VVRGRTEFPNNAIEDFVITRGDGTPVFVLANAVDDIRDGITHVRGEEHLSNTPKQLLLWEAFGAAPPVWAHLPVIVNEARQNCPSAGTRWRWRITSPRATCPGYLSTT
jgi:glutamyl-tRNA synthetase